MQSEKKSPQGSSGADQIEKKLIDKKMKEESIDEKDEFENSSSRSASFGKEKRNID